MKRSAAEAKEALRSAWQRVGDLADAIKSQSKAQGSPSMCRSMAEEIRMQCVIIHNLEVIIDLEKGGKESANDA